MTNTKQDAERVNPKWILRKLMEALPEEGRNAYIHQTIAALWAYSEGFLDKAELESGTARFSGSLSYAQLGRFCGCAASTAKWRMNALRELGFVSWRQGKGFIKFTVSIEANKLAASGIHQEANDDTEEANGLVREEANQEQEEANRPTEEANRLATLALTGFTGKKKTGYTGDQLLSKQDLYGGEAKTLSVLLLTDEEEAGARLLEIDDAKASPDRSCITPSVSAQLNHEDWHEDIPPYSAEEIRRALDYHFNHNKAAWYRNNLSPSKLHNPASLKRMMDDVPLSFGREKKKDKEPWRWRGHSW